MDTADFLKAASGNLNKNYSGDPLGLTTFIDTVRLIEIMATTNDLKALLLRFVITRLDGRAREFITDADDTVEKLIQTLQRNIKPDSSKVIEGRILALRFDPKSSQEFSKQAEELAEAFRRALVVEGIPPVKANEMAVDKTIDVCRANARSDIVKSVLEAARFEQPKEVIAKLITQVDKAKHEHQILAFQRQNKPNNRGKRGQFHNHANRPNQQYNDQNSYRGNWRGRGRGHGRGYGRGAYNSRGGYNNYQNNQYQNNQGQSYNNVRAFSNQGNEEVHAQMRMGPQNIQQNQQ